MKRTRLDKQQDFLMGLLRPLVYLWMKLDAKRKVFKSESFDFKRKEPYIMLANHTFMFDVIHVPLRLKKVPFIVANHTLFKKNSTKFLVSQVAHVISKSKGQSDSSTVRELITAVKKGYPILIFPEGDTTFFGETNYIEESTMKLIKKLELDVVTCRVLGGYLSKPRWAKEKRKNRKIELHYDITIPKEKIKDMTVSEINETIKKTLYINAYDIQRKEMIPRPGKNLASGLEDILYVCPVCESIHTMETKNNTLMCNSCKTEGKYNAYGFIEGFKFDNLVEWDSYQRKFKEKLKQTKITTTGHLLTYQQSIADLKDIGPIELIYDQNMLDIKGAHDVKIEVKDIINPVVTFRRDLTFTYQENNYYIKIDHSIYALLRALQDKY
jgi:1-acyl-sn-glycerol-3-phosphate acyltransferase